MNGILQVEDKRPALVVHIGGAKSGSTAIQHFLQRNRKVFQEMGYAIPDTDCTFAHGPANQIWYFQDLIQNPDASRVFAGQIDEIAAAYSRTESAPFRGMILSAENLSNRNGLEKAFEGLKARYRISVILYIRRQEDFYHSAWQQWHVKTWPGIPDWLQGWDGESCDWAGALDRWEAIGPESISVRIHDRRLLDGGDIIDDFCNVLGVDKETMRRPTGEVNVSYGTHVSDLYQGMPSIFDSPHDHRVEAHFWKLGVRAAEKRKGEWLFTREQIDFIRERHAAGNARVKARYFPDLPGEFLFPPVSGEDVFAPPQTELNRRNIGLLGELSIRQYRDIEAKLQTIIDRLDEMDHRIGDLEAKRKQPEKPEARSGRRRWWLPRGD